MACHGLSLSGFRELAVLAAGEGALRRGEEPRRLAAGEGALRRGEEPRRLRLGYVAREIYASDILI